MKLPLENMPKHERHLRIDQEMSLRQSLSAAKSVQHAAELALSSAQHAVKAAEHAMQLVQLHDQIEPYDDFDMCGEGYPPSVLLFLHREYPTNDSNAKELLNFYGMAIDFANEILQEDLQNYPLDKALKRHQWALTALRFESIGDLEKWASVDTETYEWLRTYRGYFGCAFSDNVNSIK